MTCLREITRAFLYENLHNKLGETFYISWVNTLKYIFLAEMVEKH